MSDSTPDIGDVSHREHSTQYDSINEFAVVGDFGFQRVPGPFEAEKGGTIWSIDVPLDAHPTVSTLSSQEGEAAAIIADGEVVGGGVITDVIEADEKDELSVVIDQYAREDNSSNSDDTVVTDGGVAMDRPALQLEESEERRFQDTVTGYGVEIRGGTPTIRESVIRNRFDDPLVVIDCRCVQTRQEIVDTALGQLGVDSSQIDEHHTGPIDLRRALDESEYNFALLEFDALDSEVQTDVAQMMKGIAEQLDSSDTKLGYTSSEAGAVVHAEPDLRMRVQGFDINLNPEDINGPLGGIDRGDVVETSERATQMEVTSVKTKSHGGREVVAKNHHGRYRLRSHEDGTVSMRGLNSKSELIGGDVEVDYVG